MDLFGQCVRRPQTADRFAQRPAGQDGGGDLPRRIGQPVSRPVIGSDRGARGVGCQSQPCQAGIVRESGYDMLPQFRKAESGGLGLFRGILKKEHEIVGYKDSRRRESLEIC